MQVQLNFTIEIRDPRHSSNGSRRVPSLDGHTHDISTSGLALIVPAIRIGNYYLAGTDRRLTIKLEIPDAPVELQVLPVRYESVFEGEEKIGYLIGARIVEMSKDHRSQFDAYISSVIRGERSI